MRGSGGPTERTPLTQSPGSANHVAMTTHHDFSADEDASFLYSKHAVPGPVSEMLGPDSTDKIHHMLHHLHNYHQTSRRRMQLLVWMGLALIYFGVATTLLVANFNEQDFIEENYFAPFHYTEFWSAFLFTLVEAFILVSADLTFESWFEVLLVCVVGVNLVSAFVAALLFSFAPHLFERPAHYIEYASQITVTLANYVFIIRGTADSTRLSIGLQMGFATLLLFMAIFKVLFYVEVFPVPMGGERASHFFEFTGEMANSMWAFIFALKQFVELSKVQRRHDTSLKHD